MTYGLSEQEWQFLKSVLLSVLKAQGASVYLFGSRAKSTHQKLSDIDILVESASDLSKLISAIAELLEESNFPYKVDIVEERNLAPSYRARIHQEKIAL